MSRRHLLVGRRAACKVRLFNRGTTAPQDVTCQGCKDTIQYVEARIKQAMRPRLGHLNQRDRRV